MYLTRLVFEWAIDTARDLAPAHSSLLLLRSRCCNDVLLLSTLLSSSIPSRVIRLL